ncbi:MAG: hypothetical protein N2999_04725 [Proteobacteria bacterium]|nr:hypothetical protein [Pseudomonadota bacterium]
MIVPFSKIQIIGSLYSLDRVINFLKEEKVIHPEKEIENFCGDLKDLLKNYNRTEETIRERIYLESLKKKLEEFFEITKGTEIDTREEKEQVEVNITIEEAEKDIKLFKGLLKKFDEVKRKNEELELYRSFLSLAEESNLLEVSSLEITGLLLRNEESAERLRKILEEKGEGLLKLIIKTDEKNNVIGLIVYPKDSKESLRKYLRDLNIPEMVTPPQLKSLSFEEKIRSIEEELSKLSGQYFLLKREIEDNISERYGLYKENHRAVLQKLKEIEERVYLYKSEKLFFIFGWIPKDRVEELKEKLKKRFNDMVLLEELEIVEKEKNSIPVIMKNSAYFKPFEIFTKVFPLPTYGSYDPTVFLGIFFPVFFGVIVGDIGYGLIILLISKIGSRLFKNNFLQDLSRVIFYGGLSALLFGFVYGEMFGEFGREIEVIKAIKILDRGHSITQMFFISIFIGVAHVILGFLLSFIRPAEKKERLVSLLLIFCIVMLISITYLLFTGEDQKILYLMMIALSLIIVLSVIFYGIIFPVELVKTIGNIVSYGRIMAIGLSSVILANIANSFLGSVGNIFVGFLVALFIHLINIVLSIFSPTIHSLRLHYVEFFSKFMKFGGKKFSPL